MELICNNCKLNLPIENFTNCKVNKHRYGKDTLCKECKRIKKLEFSHSKLGVIQTIYDSQKLSCRIRKHDMPKYTKEELKKYLLDNEVFNSLFEQWVKSNYKTRLKPSIDRLNDYSTYSFDNIRIVTFRENKSKAHSNKRNAIGTSANQCKAVVQKDLKGNIIKIYPSISIASREMNIPHQNITKVCQKKRHTAKQFRWEYLD